jgi:DNA-binding CsgD family transcriptional regulator/tetratricopeptide (TPR) repeat protein
MERLFDFRSLPLVGRESVQEKLLTCLQSAQRGHGTNILLTGERGMGKSHLTRCIRSEAERRGFQIAAGRGYRAESGVPYSLFSDAFLPLLKAQPSETLNVLTRGGAPEVEYLFPGLGPSDGPSPHLDSESPNEFRTRVLWTFAELLKEMSKRAPLLVVLEDIQWADPSSLEIVHFLARQFPANPIVLLLIRDEDGEPNGPEVVEFERSLLDQGIVETLSLPPLTREATGILLKKAFGVDEEVAGDFTDHIHQWTQGNPSFLEQTLESLIRTGKLYRKGETWLGWEVQEIKIPRTIREALAEPLAQLPPEARTLAELATVMGTRVPFALLHALSPLPEAELLETLDLLVARDILREGMEEKGVVFDFCRTLVRETILAEMGLARSRLLHAKVAAKLEAYFGEKASKHATTLAYHHLQAEGVEGGENALLFLALAGRATLDRFGNREAALYLRAALDVLDGEDPPQHPRVNRREVLRDLARALTRLGKYDEAIPFWLRAVEEAEEEGLLEELGEYRRRIGIIRSFHGEPYEALKEFETVLALPPDKVSPILLARTHLRRGIALEELGRPEEAAEELEAVLERAQELDDLVILAQAHRALVLLHIWTGRGDRVRSHADQALELAKKSGARAVEFWTYWGLAVFEGLLGNTGPMGDWVKKADYVAREMRSPLLRLRSAELDIEQAAAIGEWDRGIALGEQAITLARALSQNTILPRLLTSTSLMYLGRGEVELARPMIQEAWDVSGAGEDVPPNIHGAIPAHVGMGTLALTELDFEEAIRIARAGLALADRVGYRIWAIHRLLPLLAESYLWIGDLEGAKEIGERLQADSTPMGHRLGMAWAKACDAVVTWRVEEDPAEGARLMEEAAQALEEIPMIPDAARLRRLKAGRLADAGDRLGALEELNRVHEIFLHLGAEVELEKTRGMFRELEARPPRMASSGAGELSARELEIARLVEGRKSNKAIAKELGISPRTVSTHLSNIFQKVGVATRGQLADYMRGEGLSEG